MKAFCELVGMRGYIYLLEYMVYAGPQFPALRFIGLFYNFQCEGG